MRHLKAIGVCLILICSIFQAGLLFDATHASSSDKKETIIMSFASSTPTITYDEYAHISLANTNTYLSSSGRPLLPKNTHIIELPFGVNDVSVQINTLELSNMTITKKIQPSPQQLPLNPSKKTQKHTEIDDEIYSSLKPYPSEWFSYNVGCGLNSHSEHVTIVSVELYPIRYSPGNNQVDILHQAEIQISYKNPTTSIVSDTNAYDMVVISPDEFSATLQQLIDHKNSYGVNTFLKTTEEIYEEFNGVDKPEQIKLFIKDAIETSDIKYVLLVGGLNSLFSGIPRDDRNQGSKDWHVPVRYSNLFAGAGDDPGYISDLYYADIYKEGGAFDNWDSNNNGIFAEWEGIRKDTLDLYPDVYVGRLACRTIQEVTTMVDKIIGYEQTIADPSWFNRVIVIAGDAFQDQKDLDIQWDTTNLPEGRYTIYAQSSNEEGIIGPLDIINITLDDTMESSISFVEDDHLKTTKYPFNPIAEITSPSEGDILGNTPVDFIPPEAYSGDSWAPVTYENGIMYIRGKSYDPQPYGVVTNLKLWITNESGETIFQAYRNDTEIYYEDEWTTGERVLDGRGGTLSYFSEDFETIKLWTSNGEWNGQSDVIEALSSGSGFVHFFGHASPRTWGDQYPGIPGGRRHASITGLVTFDPFSGPPIFPMSKITNNEKLPVIVAGGCHNGQFNVSILSTLLRKPYMWTYGIPIPECWSWWLTRIPHGGSIATISNTGMGYGIDGKYCISGGLNGWLDTEFFRLYNQEEKTILGEAYAHSIHNYIDTFTMDDPVDGIGHVKAIQEWTLLGDPSLQIGGYS